MATSADDQIQEFPIGMNGRTFNSNRQDTEDRYNTDSEESVGNDQNISNSDTSGITGKTVSNNNQDPADHYYYEELEGSDGNNLINNIGRGNLDPEDHPCEDPDEVNSSLKQAREDIQPAVMKEEGEEAAAIPAIKIEENTDTDSPAIRLPHNNHTNRLPVVCELTCG